MRPEVTDSPAVVSLTGFLPERHMLQRVSLEILMSITGEMYTTKAGTIVTEEEHENGH